MAARALLLAGLAAWTWAFASAPMAGAADSVLHLPNLIFHEAGHVIFGLFGRFAGVLGGSLLQVLVPVAIAVAFWRQEDRIGVAVGAWWAGQNLLDLAPYVADARRLEMTLLGGRTGAEGEGHDWEYLLTELGWLHLDLSIALALRRAGLGIMIGALAWGAWHLWRERTRPASPGV